MPRRAATPRSACPISLALELLGDPWTLLVVRDVMFKGRHTFADLQAGGEGIASNVLTDRLARLEAAGVLTRTPSPTDARRYIYRLTDKGIALAPVMVELVLWSAAHEETAAPERELRAMRDRATFLAGLQARLRAEARTDARRSKHARDSKRARSRAAARPAARRRAGARS